MHGPIQKVCEKSGSFQQYYLYLVRAVACYLELPNCSVDYVKYFNLYSYIASASVKLALLPTLR